MVHRVDHRASAEEQQGLEDAVGEQAAADVVCGDGGIDALVQGGEALRALRFAEIVVLVLDATIGFDKQDLTIARQVIEEGRALVIAANKWDALDDKAKIRQALEDRLERSLPQARGGMGKAVYLDGRFYVLGGETASGAGATALHVYDRVDVYDPVANGWTSGAPMPTARSELGAAAETYLRSG